MKILLVNQAYYPDRVASAVYLTEYAEYLAGKGHEVTVLTSRFGYDDCKNVFHMNETANGVNIIRAGSLMIFRGDRMARIFNALFMNIAFAMKLMQCKKYDRVVAMTSPPLIGFVALIFTHLKRVRFTYWLLDINPDQAIQAGWIREKSLRTYLLQKIFYFTLKGSDSIVVLDSYMKERIAQKKINPNKIKVHSLWANSPASRKYESKANLKAKIGLEGKFVILYAGNHSICHPMDTLLNCAKHLKEDESIAFVFIGRGSRVKDVTNFKERHQLENIYQFDYQNSWQEALHLADLHVVVMGDNYNGLVHPCKIYNILTTHTPFLLIGSAKTHIADIIAQYHIGARAFHGEGEVAAEYIRQVMEMTPDQRDVFRRQTQSAIDAYQSERKMAEMEKDLVCE